MTNTIIITLCSLLLIAYLFDLSALRTRIPTVVLLLFLGWGLREITNKLELRIPDLSPVLPILGTFGLILIVLEGSLELELKRSKAKLIRRSLYTALFPMLALAFGMAMLFRLSGVTDLRISLLNSIPICVISSAIAIPSSRGFTSKDKEFVIYESSFSDIIGVLLFNMVVMNTTFSFLTVGQFLLQLVLIILVSFIASIVLAFLLNKIDHHIKFVPIILLIILIYAISKEYHLPGLIFILFFGLFIGNLDELKKYKWINNLRPDDLDAEVRKFKDLTIEGAFLIRSVFFILFGYLIDTGQLLNLDTLLLSIGITAAIFILRYFQLRIFKIPLSPLLYMAPRGLITILLFLSIETNDKIWFINKSLIIQVIILSSFVMMFGLMKHKKPVPVETQSDPGPPPFI